MKKMALVVGFMLVWGVLAGCSVAYAECYSVNNNKLLLPCIEFQGFNFKVTFNAYQEPSDPSGTYWKLNLSDVGPSDVPDSGECGSLDYFDTWIFTVPCNDGTFELDIYRSNASDYYLKQIDDSVVGGEIISNPAGIIDSDGSDIDADSYSYPSGTTNTPAPGATVQPFTITGLVAPDTLCNSKFPCVKNFIMPNKAKVNQKFTVAFSYSDPQGIDNVAEINIRMSDFPDIIYVFDPSGSGKFSKKGFYFSTQDIGSQWVEVWIVNYDGQESNRIKRLIKISK